VAVHKMSSNGNLPTSPCTNAQKPEEASNLVFCLDDDLIILTVIRFLEPGDALAFSLSFEEKTMGFIFRSIGFQEVYTTVDFQLGNTKVPHYVIISKYNKMAYCSFTLGKDTYCDNEFALFSVYKKTHSKWKTQQMSLLSNGNVEAMVDEDHNCLVFFKEDGKVLQVTNIEKAFLRNKLWLQDLDGNWISAGTYSSLSTNKHAGWTMDLCLSTDSAKLWELSGITECNKCKEEFCQDEMHYVRVDPMTAKYWKRGERDCTFHRREFKISEDYFLCPGCFHVGLEDQNEKLSLNAYSRSLDFLRSEYNQKRHPRTLRSGSLLEEEKKVLAKRFPHTTLPGNERGHDRGRGRRAKERADLFFGGVTFPDTSS